MAQRPDMDKQMHNKEHKVTNITYKVTKVNEQLGLLKLEEWTRCTGNVLQVKIFLLYQHFNLKHLGPSERIKAKLNFSKTSSTKDYYCLC